MSPDIKKCGLIVGGGVEAALCGVGSCIKTRAVSTFLQTAIALAPKGSRVQGPGLYRDFFWDLVSF